MDERNESLFKVFGEAVYRLLAQAMPVTKESIEEAIWLLSEDEQTQTLDYALTLLRLPCANCQSMLECTDCVTCIKPPFLCLQQRGKAQGI